MKKIFTCISLAAASLFATTPIMAQQQQLSDQEKAAFVKAAVPAMLEQVKQISGIDIIAFANPTINKVISSPLFGTQSQLRGATATTLTLQPDSMTMDLSQVEGLPPMMATFLKDIKITFDGYKEYSITTVNGETLKVNIPQNIKASLMGVMNIGLNLSIGEKKGLLPFSTLSASLDLGGLESFLPDLKSGKLFDMAETGTNGLYNYDITLSDTLFAIIAMLDKEEDEAIASAATTIPSQLRVKVDATAMQTKAVMKANLQAILSNATLPLGDADIYLNPQAITTGAYLRDSIITTSYKEGSNTVEDYEKIVWTSDKASGKVLKNKELVYSRVNATDKWKFEEGTLNTLTSNTEISNLHLPYSIIQGIIADLVSGKTQSFSMISTQLADEADETGKIDQKLTVTPQMVGTQAGKITIAMANDENGDGIINNEDGNSMRFIVNIPTKNETISVDILPGSYDNPVAKLYVKSNFMGIITDNETISDEVQQVKVSTTAGGLYVKNGKGNYVIVNMVGKVMGTGVITSDEQYISTPNMPNGIYMMSIDQSKALRSAHKTTVKFVK
ncbi:DUF6383 domain-containing protein [Parabacteroides sp.]